MLMNEKIFKLAECKPNVDFQVDVNKEKYMLIEMIQAMDEEDVSRLYEYAYELCRKADTSVEKGKISRLPLPVGISDYRIASESYYYVDKTMMIKEFLDERPMVSLFLRPCRFGKTLNMDMFRVFFEKTEEDTFAIFYK